MKSALREESQENRVCGVETLRPRLLRLGGGGARGKSGEKLTENNSLLLALCWHWMEI